VQDSGKDANIMHVHQEIYWL